MLWIHDDKNKRIICVSKKLGRREEIKEIKYSRARLNVCTQCWRQCTFVWHKDGDFMTHTFRVKRSEKED